MVVIDIAAVAVLALAIIYGNRMWRKRPQDPRIIEASDAATWDLYHPGKATNDKASFRQSC
jgi:hypothetical protein